MKRRDGTFLEGTSGALIRCKPDGSDPEVLCRGFVNLVEVAFTPRGDVIGTDNWFVTPTAGAGLRDALVHLIDGGLYPYEPDVGTKFPITGAHLPAASLLPAVALSGLACYRGQAFPKEMHGNLFSAQHNARKVGRHVLIPDGATFRTRDVDFVTTDDPDFHPSDVLEAADGSLLVVDTGSWYVQHCPTGQIRKVEATGGIYRVRAVNAPAPATGAAADKVRAVWALARSVDLSFRPVPDPAALAALRKALGDADADVVIAAARALAVHRDREAAPALGRLLASPSPAVRLAAAEALARCGDQHALPLLWQALASDVDAFLEHALIHAIHWLANAPALEAALTHTHPRVQRAALMLLDQPPRPPGRLKVEDVLQRAKAQDVPLRQMAIDLLRRHPEWGTHAHDLLEGWLRQQTLTPDERTGLGSLVSAFQGQPRIQELVGNALANRTGTTPVAQRLVLLEALAQCSLAKLPASWLDAIARSLSDSEPTVRGQALKTVAVLQLATFDDQVARLAESTDESADVRLEALRAVVFRRPRLTDSTWTFLLAQLRTEGDPLGRLGAAEVLGRCRLTQMQLTGILGELAGDPLIAPPVILPAVLRSATDAATPALLRYLKESLRGGWRPSEAELATILGALPATARDQAESVREVWRQVNAAQSARLAQYEPLMNGGDARQGREVFFNKKVACAGCHRVGSEGGLVGPDLTRIGEVRSGRDLLEAILLPSSTMAQGYEPYVVATNDGRIASGIIARQSAELLVLRHSSGAEVRLRKDQIQDMKRQATSIMPEGLERALSASEFRDLVAFLRSLK